MLKFEKFLRIWNWSINLDPYFIYKLNSTNGLALAHKSNTYRQYFNKQLTLPEDDWNWRQKNWFECNNLIITIVQGNILGLFFLRLYVDYIQGKQSLLISIAEFVGDPFSGFSVLVPIFLLSSPVQLYFILVVWPNMMQSLGWLIVDMTPIRYILNPEHELKRIDYLIEHTIQQLIRSIKRKRFNMLAQIAGPISDRKLSCQGNALVLRKDIRSKSIWSDLDYCEYSLIRLSNDKNTYIKFRPYNYSYYWHDRVRTRAKFYTITLMIYLNSFVIIASLFLIYQSISIKCSKMIENQNCNLFTAFKLSEHLYWLIIILSLLMITFNAVYLFLVFALTHENQLGLIKDLRLSLAHSLDQLRHFNSLIRTNNLNNNKKVYQITQSMLIKILVFDEDIKASVCSISSLLVLFIIGSLNISITFLMGFEVSKESSLETVDLVSKICFVGFWSGLNIPAIACAYVSARVFEALKLYWPIRAELLHYKRKRINTNLAHLLEELDKLSSYWNNTRAKHYTARPFGFTLTYDMVIEINFYLFSIISFIFNQILHK